MAISAHALCVNDGADRKRAPIQGAPTTHVNKSFSDVLDNLEAAAFINGSARKRQYVLQGNSATQPLPTRRRCPWA